MVVEDTSSSSLPQTVDAGLPDAGYAEVLADIKTRVDAARARALRAANVELMGVYWHIGRHIAEQQDAAPVKRGHTAPKIIERLSADLRAAYPNATGFSPRNLRYMRDFSRAWTEESIWQHGVATLPWGHIVALLGVRDPEVRAWYAERAGEWTRPVLQHHIASDLHPPKARRRATSSALCSPATPRGTQVGGGVAARERGVRWGRTSIA